jgi:hypothetical protein
LDTFSIRYSVDGTNFYGLESFTATAQEQTGVPAAVGVYSRALAPKIARYVKVGVDQVGTGFSPYPFVFLGEVAFEQVTPLTPISYTSNAAPHSSFPDTGGIELIDGIIPNQDFMNAGWIGWYGGSNPDAPGVPWVFETFDFGSNKTLNSITIYGLNDPISGIGSLDAFTVRYSNDGTNFYGLESFTATAEEQLGTPATIGAYSRPLAPKIARYVKVGVDQLGTAFSPYPYMFLGEVAFIEGTLAVPLSYTSSAAPFSSFPDTGGTELIDGIIPTTNFMDAGWIGWYGASNIDEPSSPWLFETFDFGSNVTLEYMTIYGLNDPASGLPGLDTFNISYSTDGTTFFGSESFTATAAEQLGSPAAVGVYSRALAPQSARYAKVGFDQIGSGFSPYPFMFLGEVLFKKTPTVEVVSSSLSGTVNLLDFGGDKTTVTGTVELNGTSYPLVLDANGKFTILDVADGTCDVRIKASHWLAKITTGVVVAGATVMDPVSLINGDVVDNNEVDFSDINATRAAYGSFPGDETWNEMADVDGTGEVDFTDINIVRSNYGEIGD